MRKTRSTSVTATKPVEVERPDGLIFYRVSQYKGKDYRVAEFKGKHYLEVNEARVLQFDSLRQAHRYVRGGNNAA